jgi:hypothetical protein
VNSTLALRSPTRQHSPVVAGHGTAVQTLEGCVSAFFALEHYDQRDGVATYALRVINRTRSALLCRTWIISQTGDALLAHPVLVEVGPLATSTTSVPFQLGGLADFDRAIAEIAGDGVHCIVEAPAPPRSKRTRVLGTVALASTVAGAVALGSAMLLRGAVPQIAAFAVPPEAVAGTTIRAQYDALGAGSLSYSVDAPDGRELQGGKLVDRSGSIPIRIPKSRDIAAYTLQMTMNGALGTATSTRVLTALGPHARRRACIDGIWVSPGVAEPGQKVDVAYSATGDRGYVRLLGTDGTIWRQLPFSRDGRAQFVIPPVASLHEMRVLLHVARGPTVAQSMAGLAVATAAPSAPPAAPPDQNGVFQVIESTVHSGGPIDLRILAPHSGMSIALMDLQSHEVARADVGLHDDVVTLRAPTVAVATPYTLVASFSDGYGQESVIAPITILP